MAEKEKTVHEMIGRISENLDWLDTLGEECARGCYAISDDEKAALKKINIKGLKFFKKFQHFTGVTDADL